MSTEHIAKEQKGTQRTEGKAELGGNVYSQAPFPQEADVTVDYMVFFFLIIFFKDWINNLDGTNSLNNRICQNSHKKK